MSIKNRSGLKPIDLASDVKLKAELQIPNFRKDSELVDFSLPKFIEKHKRSTTPSYNIALNSVLKGDQLD